MKAPQSILMAGAVMYIAAAIFMYSVIEFEPGWFDQTKFLISARSFAAASLAPDQHWYPLLYSLAAAPFVPLIPSAPFAVPNLIAFLAILYALFQIWSSLRLPVGVGVAGLALSLLLPPFLFHQFVVPWNTIPVAALILTALAIVLREQPLNRRSILVLSAVTATVPLFRPSDLLFLAPVLLLAAWRLRCWTWRRIIAEAALGLSLLTAIWATYAALHLSIYGAELSPYIKLSGRVGYDFSSMPEKALSIFLDPKPLYGVGASLLQECPWMLLTPYGAFLLIARQRLQGAVVVTTMVLPLFFYSAYVDLTPYSFWKYHNVHYYSLSLLLAGLCSAYAVWEVYRKPKAAFALLAFAVPISSLSYQTEAHAAKAAVVDPQTLSIECTRCGSFRALHIKGMSIDPFAIYQSVMLADADLHSIKAEGKRTKNIYDFRTIPLDDGVRIVFSEDVEYESLQVRFAVPHGLQPDAAAPDVRAISGRFGLKSPW